MASATPATATRMATASRTAADLCAETPPGSAVDPALGCSIAQLCPCNGPRGQSVPWRNHGQYQSCVAKTSESFLGLGLITSVQKDALVSQAAQSNCGRR